MITYTGNGAYCFTNSLHMSLLAAGADRQMLPGPGILECLTTMPFGKMFFQGEQGMGFFPSGPDVHPDLGLDRALDCLGWTCDSWYGGDEAEAVACLRDAVVGGTVLIGPVDMGYLAYNPAAPQAQGSDHYVVALAFDGESVTLHDPAGWPYTHLPLSDFLAAWRADRVGYGDRPYHMRWAFRQAEPRPRGEAVARALPAIRETVVADPGGAPIWGSGGPSVYGGERALRELASALQGGEEARLAGSLVWFALPLAARRLNDAAQFLVEADLAQAGRCADDLARLFGAAQLPAVRQDWPAVARLMDQAADGHAALAASLQSS